MSSIRLGALAVISAGAFCFAVTASAQVLELGPGGKVETYEGPAVFGRDGGVPIVLPRIVTGRGRAAAPAAVSSAARATAVSEDLIAAVAWSESRMRRGVVSGAGALGEMQLMPGTARALGVDPMKTDQNYLGGATYLHTLLARYNGDLIRALAAYNAGPGAVDRYGGVPPYRETQSYVAAVLDRLSRAAETDR